MRGGAQGFSAVLMMQTQGPRGPQLPEATTPRSGKRGQEGSRNSPRGRQGPPHPPPRARGLGPISCSPPTSLLSPQQRSPRSAVTPVTSSSSPSRTCGDTRSTRVAPWGPRSMRAWVTGSSRRGSAAGAAASRPTSARTVSGCSPPSTGAAPALPHPLPRPLPQPPGPPGAPQEPPRPPQPHWALAAQRETGERQTSVLAPQPCPH